MCIEKKDFISRNEAETEAFGQQLAAALPPGTVIALHGDLGAGKTVFSRGFARGLGITEPVSSPTYTIIQEYPLSDGGYFFHLDLYRINNSADALAFAVDEYLEDGDSYCLVEWSERISDIMPPNTIHLRITHLNDTERRIQAEYPAAD